MSPRNVLLFLFLDFTFQSTSIFLMLAKKKKYILYIILQYILSLSMSYQSYSLYHYTYIQHGLIYLKIKNNNKLIILLLLPFADILIQQKIYMIYVAQISFSCIRIILDPQLMTIGKLVEWKLQSYQKKSAKTGQDNQKF